MALRKIITIKNVGRFKNYAASGDVTLKRYNLIFAENGRGKTTFCAILRSLQSGEAAHVNGRMTLGSQDVPEIIILTDAGSLEFIGGAWSTTIPALSVFDSTFVSENVYSGDVVDLGHRRNLYRVIIGKDGVDLARQVDQLDAEIRANTAAIRDKRADVQSCAPQGINVEDFLALPSDPDIDAKIDAKQMELEAVRQASHIQARAALTKLALPLTPDNLPLLLAKTVQGLAADASRRLAAQIVKHAMQARGENWLSEGLAYVRDEKCPFCSQPVGGLPLIEAYSTYFSAAYRSLKQEILTLRASVATTLGDRAIAEVERTFDANDAAAEFWTRYCEFARPQFSSEVRVGDALRALRQAALDLLEQKAAAPLEQIAPAQAYADALRATESARQAATAYNEAVQTVNAVITAKKASTGRVDASTVEAALRRLQATKARHQPVATAASQAHQDAIGTKEAKEAQKAAARSRLDEYTSQIIGRYERTINNLLDDFQAGFRITGTKHTYPGGVPSSSFQILINDTPVDLGDANTPLDTPSFRNTLSSGDRSTLALAFFLAQLEHATDKPNRIVVFDDPFNSQDAFRKDHTVEKIRKCGEVCAQVVVLSHDQLFLKRIWQRLAPAPHTGERKCLQMIRVGLRNTAISEWDIDRATQHRFAADIRTLARYYNAGEGDPRDVVSKIRPVLEAYCRNLSPSQFLETDMLPTIITKIRQVGPTQLLASVVDDMDTINLYTSRYHHGEGPQPASEIINDSELQGFVRKTLTITGCC
jgi:wobble nucleotide-excising tRNase